MSTESAVMAAGMPTVMVVTAAAVPLPLADELLVPQLATVSATPVASSRARVTTGLEDALPPMALIIADYRLSVAGGARPASAGRAVSVAGGAGPLRAPVPPGSLCRTRRGCRARRSGAAHGWPGLWAGGGRQVFPPGPWTGATTTPGHGH